MIHSELTGAVLAASRTLYNILGPGLSEISYQRALEVELSERKVPFKPKVLFDVLYKTRHVGRYIADLVVNGLVVVELKAVDALAKVHEMQALTYLHVSSLPVALLVNFGADRLETRRLQNRHLEPTPANVAGMSF